MKRKISILIIAIMLISLCACKRSPVGDVGSVGVAEPDALNEIQQDENSDDENSEIIEAADKTNEPQESVGSDKQAEPDAAENNKQPEDTSSDVSGGSEQADPDIPKDEVPETDPYLPVALGYVEVREVDGKKQYVAKQDHFTVEFPVTDEIAIMALKETNKEYRVANYVCNSDMDFGIYKNFEELEAVLSQEGYVVVKGSFLPEHGTSVVEYDKGEMNNNVNMDYYFKFPYARYSFKVDKIYTPCVAFNVGDVIPVVKSGSIVQQPDGTYLASEGMYAKYRCFVPLSLAERTFVLALSINEYERYGGYSNAYIFMNANENVQDGTGDKDKQIAYDILQKYN